MHGDYRLDNLLVDSGGRIAAVLDWEMATLGDPLTDLALLLVYMGRQTPVPGTADASGAPGFPAPEEVLARYAARSGRDVSRIGFYVGLACFKLAVISEGIHYRYIHGQTVGRGSRPWATPSDRCCGPGSPPSTGPGRRWSPGRNDSTSSQVDHGSALVCDTSRPVGAVQGESRIAVVPAGVQEEPARQPRAPVTRRRAGRFRGAGADAAGPPGPPAP